MHICPLDLEICRRSACAGGHCRKADEAALQHCYDCGALLVFRGITICVGCYDDAITETKED